MTSPSSPAPRGRAVRARRETRSPWVFIGLGILVIGIVAIVVIASGGGQSADAGRVVELVPESIPQGQTPEGFYYKGSDTAPVVVTEFADFQCPACAQYASRLGPTIDARYIKSGQVRLIYHELPIQGHANAVPAAEAARCAGDQGAFWRMHDMLFVNQRQWAGLASPDTQFAGYAAQIGLDRTAFERCMADDTHRSAIEAAGTSAAAQQIPGTPTFVIDGEQYDAATVQSAIEAALAGQ